MSGDAEKELSAELQAGERLRWSGRPRLGIHLGRGDALGVPLSCAWLGFALHWELNALRVDDGGFFATYGLAFVIAGMYSSSVGSSYTQFAGVLFTMASLTSVRSSSRAC